MTYTTLNKIKACDPCAGGWRKLLESLGKHAADDAPLSLLTILESNGIEDAIWALCAVDGMDREIRLFAVWCARQVQHLMTDPRSLHALDVAERHANGESTDEELAAARDAALDARDAALAAARDVVWAAAGAAARDAAWDAALDAAWAAALDARDAARDAALDAAWAAQSAEFRRVFCQEVSK